MPPDTPTGSAGVHVLRNSASRSEPFDRWTEATMARFWLAVLVLPFCVACLDRARVNTRCDWDENSVRALALNDWSQQRHLYEDVELAEELAIRYADAVHKERFGFDGHGGLIENGRLRDRCMAALVSTIAAAHDLPVERVKQARLRGYRDPRWDVGVLLSFTGLYGLIAWRIVRRISRRFPVDDGWPALIAPLLASVPVGMAAFQFFILWGGGLEAIRLGMVTSAAFAPPGVPGQAIRRHFGSLA
jgi:hypothetical protein